MLFDLRAPGRKRLIKVIYLILALVLVGGIFVGVGTGLPSFFDGSSSKGPDLSKQQRQRVERSDRQLAAHPHDAQALAASASALYDLAVSQTSGESTSLSAKSKRTMSRAAARWKQYLDTDPKSVDLTVARKMVIAFQPGSLNRPDDWADAQGIVTQAAVAEAEKAGTRPPVGPYIQLLQAELAAGRKRQADVHAKEALAAAPAAQRDDLKAQIQQLKTGGGAAGAQKTPGTITLPEGGGK